MEYCPYLERLIDSDHSGPLGSDLKIHLLTRGKPGEAWEVIQEIRRVIPNMETYERGGREIEEERQWIDLPQIAADLIAQRTGGRQVTDRDRTIVALGCEKNGPGRTTRPEPYIDLEKCYFP